MTLTNPDKKWVADLLDNKLEGALNKQEQKFEAKLTEFRDDFYTKIDPILKEVVASREDRAIGAEQHRRNEVRIEKIEKKLNLQPSI